MIALDLRNYWDKTPSELARMIQVPIGTIQTTIDDDESALRYAAARCRVTRQCVTRLISFHRSADLGRLGWTVSGTAMAAFRHHYMRHNIEIPPSQSDRDFERRGYYNGRTECFWLGEMRHGRYIPPVDGLPPRGLMDRLPVGPFHLIDSRSFYGAVATFQSVPIACTGEGDGPPTDRGQHDLLTEDYLAEVRIVSDRHEFPVRLPDRTIFARGDFWTVLCGPELKRAVDTGCVVDVGHWRRYETETALRSWGIGMWKHRVAAEASGDLLLASLCKSLMARLHGKFNQRANRWKVVTGVLAPKPWHCWNVINSDDDTVAHYRSIGWEVQRQEPAGDHRFAFPALAAYVTAYGREWLRTWMRLAGPRNVLYASTDSLIVTDEGKCNLERCGIISNDGIGSCRIQETSGDIAIYGANHYRLGGKSCYSGLPTGGFELQGSVVRYTRRASLRATLGRKPTEQITEIGETAVINPSQDCQRLTPAGWLDQITLSQESERWQKQTAESLM